MVLEAKYNFQYCQKLVVLSPDHKKIFLAKRQGEADYDGAWSFIGGKMETSDPSIIAGLKREKDEEVGKAFRLRVYPGATKNLLFRKKDGSAMILPHYLAIYDGGEIQLNQNEYSQSGWFTVEEMKFLEPKIENVPELVDWALKLLRHAEERDFVAI